MIPTMNAKQQKTLAALFKDPVRPDLKWRDVLSALRALKAEVLRREGSRVRLSLGRLELTIHTPHGAQCLKPYQVRILRQWLTDAGVAL